MKFDGDDSLPSLLGDEIERLVKDNEKLAATNDELRRDVAQAVTRLEELEAEIKEFELRWDALLAERSA